MCPLESISTDADILRAVSGSKLDELEIKSLLAEYTEKLGTGEITETEFWDMFCQKLDVPIPKDSQELWRKGMARTLPYEKVFALVKDVKDRGYRVCVLSNTIFPHAEIIREKGWYAPFDDVFLSYELKMRKPDKGIYQYVLDAIKMKAENCLYIDDLPENLIPAQGLGIQTILAISPEQIVEDVKAILG